MRRYVMLVGLAAVVTHNACSKKDAPGNAPIAQANVVAAAAAPQPRFGGAVVALGDNYAEVLPHADGRIEAAVMNKGGQPLGNASQASLVAHATAKGGAETDARLTWHPTRELFLGHARSGKLAAGPLRLQMTLQGKSVEGLVPMVAVVPAPHFGGRLMTLGDLSAETMAHANGTVSANLWDAQLEPVTGSVAPHLDAQLQFAGGKSKAVTLDFDPASATFEGKADFSGVQAPIGILLSANVGGKVNTGAVADLALVAEPLHGGVMVDLGNYSAEVVTGAHGLVEAFVMDASGNAHAAGDLGVHLDFAGAPAVALKWDAPSACYRANLAAGIDVRPIELRIEAAGRSFVGAVAHLKASAEADLHAAAAAEANVHEEARANAHAGIAVEPPSVHVTPPKLEANVNAMLGVGNGAKGNANAAANVQAPSIQVKPPSLSAKAGANADAKTGANGKVNIGH